MGMQVTMANLKASTPSPVPLACSHGCRFFHREKAGTMPPPSGPLLQVARHTPIYAKGEDAHFCYKVISGAVTLSQVLPDGHRQILNICLPGDTFGLASGETHAETAESVGEALLLRCPRACIVHLNDERPDIRRALLDTMRDQLCEAQDHLVMLGRQGARERVASYLLRLADARKADVKSSKDDLTLELPVGRQDLADYLGLTIETTCRALSDLKAAKVISTPSRHEIVVHDLSALQAMAS